MSEKQLARSVRDGTLLFVRGDGLDINGYLAGWDTYYYLILASGETTITKHLVHKGGVHITIPSDLEGALDNDPNKEQLEQIIGPFRQKLEKETNLLPPASSRGGSNGNAQL